MGVFLQFTAPEQRWPYPDQPYQDEKMPFYDEKVDMYDHTYFSSYHCIELPSILIVTSISLFIFVFLMQPCHKRPITIMIIIMNVFDFYTFNFCVYWYIFEMIISCSFEMPIFVR